MSGMIIDGVFASEAIDSSGEILDVKGCDISDLEQGQGVLNWEHRGDDAEGASANDIIGKIVFAKKIFGPEDCSDARQLDYWQKIQLPLIYGIVRLFDSSGHPGAVAAAAIIRDYEANKEPLLIRYSIEGTTLKKDKSSNRLLESIARRVAATIKPCNKSCFSGVISDPGATAATKKAEAELPHPNFTPLGGSFEYSACVLEADDLNKTLTAGSYNVAPGNLVGGSALQVEDRSLRNRVKAAVRDWDRTTPFRKFLKHRLPEASDEFVDRFSDLVQDFTIKKAQRDLLKSVVKQKIAQKIQAKATEAEPPADGPLTIRGVPVTPNPTVAKPHFDETSGVLHTPQGSFPMYIPSRDQLSPDAGEKFHRILQSKKASKFHDFAMKNWVRVHEHLKKGTLPPEVTMHGVIFSQLSPNTPVPMQELMYAHLVDAMHHTGIDPRDPDPKRINVLRQDWLDRDSPSQFPDHSRSHFKRLDRKLRLKADSVDSPDRISALRSKGDIGAFMMAPSKWQKGMQNYSRLHEPLHELVMRHRHDARGAVEELMHHKVQADLWDARRQRELDKGHPDIGDYNGPAVPGLAPKTARYTYGMLGGGNATVPDTHFIRYLFGLERTKDKPSIEHMKDVLWNPRNAHILNAIDRYYAQHHDAVKHMLSHPTWGKYFENPEDAVFPAFWKNWVAILPHEAARGMKNFGWNEGTDHKPYWDAINPYLRKNDTDTNLASRTAAVHAQWAKEYGEMPAMLMYYHYLVPQLLDAGEARQQAAAVRKFEAVAIELSKSDAPRGRVSTALEEPLSQEMPETVQFNGKTVRPGKAYDIDSDEPFALLDHHPNHYVAVPVSKIGGWEPSDLVRLDRQKSPRTYHLLKHPEHLDAPSIVSHEVHTLPEFTHHPETKELVHGLDLDSPGTQGEAGMNRLQSTWKKNAQGKMVYVKLISNGHTEKSTDFDGNQREALFHNLARDFFGLGHYVTPTTLVMHPSTGRRYTVAQHTPGEHYENTNADHRAHLRSMWDSGELQKIGMMDTIAHSLDRHYMNYLLDQAPGGQPLLKLIDNEAAFSERPIAPTHTPSYLKSMRGSMHPQAQKWLTSLDPNDLVLQMRRHLVPEPLIRETHRRLVRMQKFARQNGHIATYGEVLDSPFMS